MPWSPWRIVLLASRIIAAFSIGLIQAEYRLGRYNRVTGLMERGSKTWISRF
ncbi:hypothetical protein [Nitrosomonas sp.]|uniref:hypothetical protein n=1 Tax=Nitrosomonas sp. TaxID=42353 RepID=UPI002AC938AF|nr:hypothetical protein [Nitrosomonas sp.]